MPRKENVERKCDRCEETVDGFRMMVSRKELKEMNRAIPTRWNDKDEFPMGTAGYYRTSEGQWAEYADEDEDILCDECMTNDPDYQEMYSTKT